MSERIVTKSLKVDFHIHSFYSKYKDEYNLVKDNNEENIDVLVKKLIENEVEMAAITDHDYFSYSMYETLKKYEENNTFKKIFPGVEFSVGFKNDANILKPVHIICLFDDKNQEKVKKIADVLKLKDGRVNYYDNENFFSEEKFISLLNQIDLNVVMIAHQKNSVSSKEGESDNDLMSLGSVKFNEFIESEYFESLEFKSLKNGMFNNIFANKKNKNYDVVRFITGSDCHTWEIYPKHDEKESNEINFKHTYLKCLPTFKGIAMALTDNTRIKLTDSAFSLNDKKVKSISLEINNIKYTIPMSSGINVIIGDNSIGKSMLIHKITNYEYLVGEKGTKVKGDSARKVGYESYLASNKIKVYDSIDKSDIYAFDYQGSVRDKFEVLDIDKNKDFLTNKFPSAPNKNDVKSIIETELTKFYAAISNKFHYDDELKKLKNFEFVLTESKTKNLSITKINQNDLSKSRYEKIVAYLNKIISSFDEPSKYIETGLDRNDSELLLAQKNEVIKLHTKYKELLNSDNKLISIKTGINCGIQNSNKQISEYKDEIEKKENQLSSNTQENSITICNLRLLTNLFCQ